MSVVLTVVFLLGNAFFVGAQFALITTRRDQLAPLAARGNRRATVALRQIGRLDRMLAASQLGIALCSLGLGALAEPVFAHGLSGLFDAMSLPHGVLHPVAFVLALIFVSFLHMVLGEMVPKNLALAGPVSAALWLSPPMALWTKFSGPLLSVINGLANLALRIVGITPRSELHGSYGTRELTQIVEESAAEGLLADTQEDRLQHALALDTLTASEIAITPDQVISVPASATIGDLQRLLAEHGYSRYPILDGERWTGYVHTKDLLWLDSAAATDPLPRAMTRTMPVIAPTLTLTETLEAMRHSSAHMAVIRPAGRLETTRGIVTLEDVLDHLLGEVDPDPGT